MRKPLLLLVLLSGAVYAEDHVVMNNKERATYRLGAGDTLNILGNHCAIRVEGSSGTVNVNGNHNQILVDGSVQLITLNGNHNSATILVTNGKPGPEVLQVGRYNDVTHKPR